MDKDLIRRLFTKLADGTISHSEYQLLMDYLANNQGDDEGLLEDPIQESAHRQLPPSSIKRALKNVQRRTGIKQRRNTRLLWVPLAAAALIVAFFFIDRFGEMYPQQDRSAFVSDIPIVYETLEVPLGKRDSLVLGDGSVVWVNAGSKLTYPKDFPLNSRVVKLEGEAFFDVVPMEGSPFIVETGNVRTVVLGTAFNVKAYDSTVIDVSVLRGKVRIDESEASLAVLTANQHANLTDKNQIRVTEINALEAMAWVHDRLVFRDVHLDKALEVLERWFDVSFSYSKEAVANCVFSASFEKGETLEQVLSVIGKTNGITYTKTAGNNISIKGVGCP